ncbi:hypothetical protein CTZ27_20935 [Streptomyces griseocarneus]|nr:hypothetical protein CTZ27_20935 [Streptomyces griseocarneus]
MLLMDIEADLDIKGVWFESKYPVAELAYRLVYWLRDGGQRDFELDSMSYADKGVVRIVESDDGWRIGSVYAPGKWTEPYAWDALVAEIRQFVRTVTEGVATIGIEPGFLSRA